MICNICNKEVGEEIDKITLICMECADKLEKRWEIDKLYLEEDNYKYLCLVAECKNVYYPDKKKTFVQNIFNDGIAMRTQWEEKK